MEEIRSLIADVPAVWRDLDHLKQAFVVLKAIADFTFCGLTPLLFGKTHMTLRTVTLMPLVALCFVSSDAAMFFALSKAAERTQIWIGLLLVLYSLVFFWWAQYTMKTFSGLTAAFSDDAPTFLITSGPWAFVRNPLYSAYLASLLAGFIVTSSSNHPDHGHAFLVSHAGGIALSALLVVFSIYYSAIREEEAKFDSSKLRSKYEAYKKKVWRFLPLGDVFGR
ncbi:Phospholipid methyltransferase [Kalmanozyma brasiliensis GHG001]|uniref:Protein-S-isoprenylcysteine O-methyltransferase n=1 Tax=Kalmanozyma brasiliensis (strain GHG001) TaxID=1365824 RepID=V5GSQ6_KALBG|nr:Phospholipid methyltransferase [Kalmanozyma brasiliensis GHG001]EST08957.1 Phospholipid methyltransferase [Kalmanozyma brasiliensis GHG001]